MTLPTDQDVVAALEKSGYLFENEVAVLLQNLGFHVDVSWAYLDSESEKSREIDIRAIKRVANNESEKLDLFVELLVECKDSSSPLVFLESRKNQRELNSYSPREYLFPLTAYRKRIDRNSYREVPPFEHLGLKSAHYYFSEENKATQFAKIVRKGKDWVANHDGIYDAYLLPLAKLFEFRRRDIASYIGRDKRAVWLVFPMIVVRDHLYAYDLTGPQRVLEKRGRITFVRHLESKNLKGFFLTDFISFENLTAFVCEELQKFVGAVTDLMEKRPHVLKDADWNDVN